MKYILIALALLVTFATAQVQGVFGYVSKGGMEPAENALVRVESTTSSWSRETYSGSNGFYEVFVPQAGSNRVKASKWYGVELWASDWKDFWVPFNLMVREDIILLKQ